MTKHELVYYLDCFDDSDDVSYILYEIERQREQFIEEIEERQHMNGFYSFQDKLEVYRREK